MLPHYSFLEPRNLYLSKTAHSSKTHRYVLYFNNFIGNMISIEKMALDIHDICTYEMRYYRQQLKYNEKRK